MMEETQEKVLMNDPTIRNFIKRLNLVKKWGVLKVTDIKKNSSGTIILFYEVSNATDLPKFHTRLKLLCDTVNRSRYGKSEIKFIKPKKKKSLGKKRCNNC